MAKHIYLNGNEVVEVNPKYLSSSTQMKSAEIAQRLIQKYSDIEVKDIQIPKDLKYTCWYVSVKGYPKLPTINLTLQNNGSLNIEFRYMQFISPQLRDKLQWQTGNWPYARISPSGYTEQQVIDIMSDYIPKTVEAIKQGILKRGGTSAAERVIYDIFSDIYEHNEFVEGERPEWLRNPAGNLLQLDFLLPSQSIAIEIQGPTHFKDIYNDGESFSKRQQNDNYKVKKCLENSISMVWMNSEGIQKELVRMQFSKQKEIINQLLQVIHDNHPCYVVWNSPSQEIIIER